MPRRLYIQTVGCQMNVLDSELIAGELLRAGYAPAESLRRADVALLNGVPAARLMATIVNLLPE